MIITKPYLVVSDLCLVPLAVLCRIDVSKPGEFSFHSIGLLSHH